MDESVSVVIPTLNAEKELPQLINALLSQKESINEIIVIDSKSDDKTREVCENYSIVKYIGIERDQFDHGKTRDYALRRTIGDIVVFLTQDAVPANENLIEELIRPLEDKMVAVSTGRQVPKKDAWEMERIVRKFNYPDKKHTRSREDIEKYGIKTFFCSDVCAAYNKNIYLKLGGFDYPLKTNEDMFFAAKAINNGYKIVYTNDAIVYHSHNFTLKQQYKRNYLQGYEIQKHRKMMNDVSQNSEGIKLVKHVSMELLKKGHIISLIHFTADCIARYIGSNNGRRAAIRETRNTQKRYAENMK